jgi:CrcB protein
MNPLLLIALGGGLGAVTRYLAANAVYDFLGRNFPHGTLFVNVSGSFIMGLLAELILQRSLAPEYRAALLVGFLGGYTTFSSFSLETLYLFEEGGAPKALLNIFLSVTLCLAGVWLGLLLGRQWFAGDWSPVWQGHRFTDSGLGLGAAFALALLAEWASLRLGFRPEWRAAALIALLGLCTVASTLWLAFRLAGEGQELRGLLGLFAINALLGALAAWLGNSTGQWLWQLNQSR